MTVRSCVAPPGHFIYTIHRPRFRVANFRETDPVTSLGPFEDGTPHMNSANFPPGRVPETGADWTFEIPNALPFRGRTFILKSWADTKARRPHSICLPDPPSMSFHDWLARSFGVGGSPPAAVLRACEDLPEPLRLALAVNSTDPRDLEILAEISCRFAHDSQTGRPTGIRQIRDDRGTATPCIRVPALFEAVANNRHLPDDYKTVMVLRPGAQGQSEIVGEWCGADADTHVFEYLRRNSYIPWGHYAANMADDAVRYRLADLTPEDITGMRHLYYQRTCVRMAETLNIAVPQKRRSLTHDELETLRLKIMKVLKSPGAKPSATFGATLWGWNFGFDFSPSGYRLHASHQQIHQQYALVPDRTSTDAEATAGCEPLPAYAFGDLVADFIRRYRRETGCAFFEAYIRALRNNRRLDANGRGPENLIVWETERVLVYVPKAQTSQWEIQMMPVKPVGHILEADTQTRRDLDFGMLLTMQILERMGARMITVIESSKRFDSDDPDHRLLYAFLPRLPQSPGAFSEAQLRWINGHYPEDFAEACRNRLPRPGTLDANMNLT
jgi:hypothetical protein